MPAVQIGSIDELRERFASLAEKEARRAIADRGRFTVAVSGGSVATLLLARLVRASIDWRLVDVVWVDERAVPADAPESNVRGARQAWIDRVPLRSERVHPMPADTPDLSEAAARYERTLRQVLGDRPAIDLVVLGVGPDGHVASLFPGHRLLAEETRWVAGLEDAPKPPPRRLTVTLPVLRAARTLAVFATGAEKAGAIADALGPGKSALPLARALDGPERAVVLLDAGAASALRAPIR